jgi:outer membrane receptor for ferrienterochelin and colicin
VNTFTAGIGRQVPLDSVQEYCVIRGDFSAEYGRATGGVVNVATKSGTNEFHGTAYERNFVNNNMRTAYAEQWSLACRTLPG